MSMFVQLPPLLPQHGVDQFAFIRREVLELLYRHLLLNRPFFREEWLLPVLDLFPIGLANVRRDFVLRLPAAPARPHLLQLR